MVSCVSMASSNSKGNSKGRQLIHVPLTRACRESHDVINQRPSELAEQNADSRAHMRLGLRWASHGTLK